MSDDLSEEEMTAAAELLSDNYDLAEITAAQPQEENE